MNLAPIILQSLSRADWLLNPLGRLVITYKLIIMMNLLCILCTFLYNTVVFISFWRCCIKPAYYIYKLFYSQKGTA